MPEPLSDAELQRLMHETREAVQALRDGRIRPDDDADLILEGRGEAYDGRIVAVALRGRLASLELDPRVKRMPPHEVGEGVKTAVNTAFDDLGTRASAAGAVPDLAALSDQMREMENDALREMEQITQGIVEAMDLIRERTHINGEPRLLTGMEQLFDLTRRNLAEAIETLDSTTMHEAEAHGADGRLRVVIRGGRITTVTIDSRALRMAAADLSNEMVVTVNEALDAGRDRMGLRTNLGDGKAADLEKHVREVQDMGLKYATDAITSLTEIMSSIQGPDE